MNDYTEGFMDCRTSVLDLIDEWYKEYKPNLDNLPLPLALGFLKRAIVEADVVEME